MRSLAKSALLDLPHLPADDRLRGLLGAALDADRSRPDPTGIDLSQLWRPSHFGLDRTVLFTAAPESQRTAIMDRCCRGLLEEAYFIEKAGIAFAAKMILSSETTEERMLYGLFGADEATHLAAVSRFLPGPIPVADGNPFLALLAEVIDHAERETLVFVIQVVLEGWGLTHYGQLARGCTRLDLTRVLHRIVRDEARHHGSGVVIFEKQPTSPRAIREIVEILVRFLALVQAGPQGVVATVSAVRGGLERADRVKLFAALDAQAHSAARLALLKKLMLRAAAYPIVDELERLRAFEALSAEACAG